MPCSNLSGETSVKQMAKRTYDEKWCPAPRLSGLAEIVQLSRMQLNWRSWRVAVSRSVILWDGMSGIPWSFWQALSRSLVAASTTSVATWHSVNWVIDVANRLTAASSMASQEIQQGMIKVCERGCVVSHVWAVSSHITVKFRMWKSRTPWHGCTLTSSSLATTSLLSTSGSGCACPGWVDARNLLQRHSVTLPCAYYPDRLVPTLAGNKLRVAVS